MSRVVTSQPTPDRHCRQRLGCRRRQRLGALISSEMLLTFPILAMAMFGVVEMSLLVSTSNQLQLAAKTGARVGAVTPGVDLRAVEEAVREVLGEALSRHVTVRCSESGGTGGMCRVTVMMPRNEAAPDLLGMLGFRLTGNLEATTSMRIE